MASGVDMTEPKRLSGGILLNFPASDEEITSSSPSNSQKAPPRRLRRRLLGEPKTPLSAEDIEAKLREADLRRQQFYGFLASKAKSKSRSLPKTGPQEVDGRRQLEAGINAAEQKKSEHSQLEIEGKRMKDQLQYQLKRAKRKREEYLRRRRNLNSRMPANSKLVDEECFSTKIARYWRHFVKLRKTTLSFAKAYASLEINEESVKLLPFEQLALSIKSAKTVNTTKALLGRLESRLKLSLAARGSLLSLANIDHLLRCLAFPHCKGNSSDTTQGEVRTTKSVKEEAETPAKFSRYPVRVVLCAYMIMGHPDAVLNGQSECEITLAHSAVKFIREFELLVKKIIDGPIQTSQEAITSAISDQKTIRSQLEAYDKAWCSYLHDFLEWKLKDAELLEKDLVKAACQLELSMMQTRKLTLVDDGDLACGMKAIKKQVSDEQKFLREKVQHLTGNAGLERMEHALAEMQSKFVEGKESGNPFKSSCTPSGLELPPIPTSVEANYLAEGCQVSSRSIHSSETDDSSSSNGIYSSPPESTSNDSRTYDPMLFSENELLVNDIIHGHCQGFADSLNAMDKDQNNVKAKVRETMEKAFWDGIAESIKQDEPDFSWILKLIKEVRDELCEISPQNWRQEIIKTIDVDSLLQVMKSGTLDVEYLGKSLEFALVTLEKLSAPVNDEEMRSFHTKLLRELGETSRSGDKSNASFSLLMTKGLQFVLQEIQVLKRQIIKARIKFVEPLINGPAGLEYLKRSFTNRYGPPADAQSSLKLTRQWLSSVHPFAEQEWDEYIDSLSALPSNRETSQVLPTTLRTGCTISTVSTIGSPPTGSIQPECRGEKVDTLVRLGLLKLVSGVAGLTLEALPETLKLNLSRVRAVQSQYQKVIVISTSILILREMLVCEKLVSNAMDMENILSKCIKKLSLLLDSVEDVGISEIVTAVCELLKGNIHTIDAEKLRGKDKIIESMLGKSLQAGDAVFVRVSRCVYLAFIGAVVGGSGYRGRQLVVSALERMGAALLADRVTEAAEILVVVATVSCSVHRAWYEELLKNI